MFRMSPIIIGFLFLTACTVRVGPPSETTKGGEGTKETEVVAEKKSISNEVNQFPAERETHNVTYRGIVQPAGISIYMQGSHRLLLSDGRFLLLESDTVDLNGYVGEEVEISGSTRATIEANGIIMRVENTKLILPPPEAETSSESSLSSLSEEKPSELIEEPTTEVPLEPREASVANEAIIEAMSAENFSPENWTQEYCSSHIGFCIPIHRNWWYKSFGTTTSTLWHVEVGNSPVLNLADGPISINLLYGDLSSLEDQETTTVQVHDDIIVGSRPWSGDRHFEIRASITLEAAVRYMIEHINPYEEN